MNSTDVLAFGAHPDDIEIGCGGTIIKLADAGRRVVLVDLVRGEMGTRGSAEIRAGEAEKGAEILGVAARENLELEDGHIEVTKEGRRRVAEAVRRWRPGTVFLPYWEDRHPDHSHASRLVYEGTFLAGLSRFDTGQESHRPTRLIYYMGWYEFEPTFIVDITEQFERKMGAIYAYSTQFHPEGSTDPQTCLTSPSTDWLIRSRMAYYGARIRVRYGEGFLIRGHLAVDDPLQLDFESF
jgi:bacillithiol biosynthesis deacetylase BshB1